MNIKNNKGRRTDPGLVRFSLVGWHIKHCMLFNAKSIFIHINSSI